MDVHQSRLDGLTSGGLAAVLSAPKSVYALYSIPCQSDLASGGLAMILLLAPTSVYALCAVPCQSDLSSGGLAVILPLAPTSVYALYSVPCLPFTYKYPDCTPRLRLLHHLHCTHLSFPSVSHCSHRFKQSK